MKALYNVQRRILFVRRRTLTTTLLLLVGSALLILFAACSSQGAGMNTTTVGINSGTMTAAVITKPMPPTQTSCPANGQGRAAVTAPLASGNHQAVVYIDTSSSKSMLKSYDTVTRQTTTLTSVPVSGNAQVALVNAQVSADGQYVLFLTGRKLQMIRKDGQGLQTLYCYPQATGIPGNLTNLLWSPNQQLAVFEEPPAGGGPAGPVVRLLNLSNGRVQTIANSGQHVSIQLDAWLGNTQVYYTIYAPPMTALYNNVYALNVTAPADKNSTQIATIVGNLWDMNLTPDGKSLVLSQCADVLTGSGHQQMSPSLITTQPVKGGTLDLIYGSHVHAVVQSRVFNQGVLFVIQDSTYMIGPQDGLWKMNFDGSDVTSLLRGHTTLADTRTTWANVSRDGTLYAAVNHGLPGANLSTEVYVGRLSGGLPTRFIATNDTVSIAGWTTR